jgi:hypothetical protein
VDATVRETPLQNGVGAAGGPALPAAAARLQAIHDLVHSGDYHVPAAVIADRMIERMMAEKREHKR